MGLQGGVGPGRGMFRSTATAAAVRWSAGRALRSRSDDHHRHAARAAEPRPHLGRGRGDREVVYANVFEGLTRFGPDGS
jgi:hypothetical protein